MNRLTARESDGYVCRTACNISDGKAWEKLADYEDTNHTPEECAAAFEELAAYRDAEQDGTLLRLPCKVGDIIYDIRGDWETGEPMLNYHRVEAIYPTIRENGKFGFDIFATDFGFSITEKTNMYYSREAAEAALKEQEANDGKQ